MKLIARMGTAVVSLLLAVGAVAQNYPTKPVKVVVGYAAGGAVDVVARTIGQSLQTSLGQPFVVENKPGAGTNIAVKSVIAAEPDGHTLMMAANALAANMSLYKPQPFDAEKDLVAVSLIGRVPVVIAANPNVPYANIQQLIASAKGKPNSIAYGSPGNGSTPHMAIELFARAAGIDLQHIPYRGGSPAITDTIGGQVPLVAVNALEVLPHAKSG
ncbi:MAG: tripartite tricarboxylate transporter substrate-binding protein, partial [Limnohabitans sp.]